MGAITRGYDPVSGDDVLNCNGKFKLDGVEITRMETQADSAAVDVATLKADFNALLAKLKASGLMSTT